MGRYLTREDINRALWWHSRQPMTMEEVDKLLEAWKKQFSFTLADIEKGEQNKNDDVSE